MKAHHAVVGSSAFVIMFAYVLASRRIYVACRRAPSTLLTPASSTASAATATSSTSASRSSSRSSSRHAPTFTGALPLTSAYSEVSPSNSWFSAILRLFHTSSTSSAPASPPSLAETVSSISAMVTEPHPEFTGPFVAAIDQGTQSTRCFLLDSERRIVSSHQVPVQLFHKGAGKIEQDPRALVSSVMECVQAAVQKAQSLPGLQDLDPALDIKCLGLANQRETLVVWNRHTGEPLYNAIVWMDSRNDELCDELVEKHGSRDVFRDKVGLPIHPYFTATKLMWLMRNSKTIANAIHAGDAICGTVDSWIIWNLTKGSSHVTDVTNASRTLLLNLHTLQWDEEVCRELGVPLSLLPRVCSSSTPTDLGVVSQGPLHGVPITGCVGDQQAALIGQRCFRRAETKSTYGTGCFMLMNTGAVPVPSTHGLLTTVGYRFDLPRGRTGTSSPHPAAELSSSSDPAAEPSSSSDPAAATSSSSAVGSSAVYTSSSSSAASTSSTSSTEPLVAYALEGAVNVAGVGLSWLTDQMGMLDSVLDIDEVAGSVPHTRGMYLVPAFEGLYAPRWRPDARGTAVGMTLRTTKAHFCRALLDGIALQCKEVVDAMLEDVRHASSGDPDVQQEEKITLPQLLVDGGLSNSNVLLQIQAHALNTRVARPENTESTVMGAAYAAGVAIGMYDPPTVPQVAQNTTDFHPLGEDQEAKRMEWLRGWNKAVERSLDWHE